ncbi:hypothetical protein EDB92DRAFT_1842490 [Lactarius akahatsu]|uniref:Uncharacterized protein n=1 Tax=Lactarius akahatsu TaxID=416441 RepID=A0AAD4LLS1_9AGAM|nr:hypothetical protein EDB92DRAFT_1842490 [Lactarius akahatsu]
MKVMPNARQKFHSVESPGMGQPHVVEGTSMDGGGSGSATGNNNKSNWGWFGTDPVGKSVNASTTGLLCDGLNPSRHSPAESGESQLPPPMGKTLPAETQKPQEAAHAKGHFMARADVPHAAAVGPTAAGNSPEGGGKVDEKVVVDDWGIPVKKKGGTNAGAPVAPALGDVRTKKEVKDGIDRRVRCMSMFEHLVHNRRAV